MPGERWEEVARRGGDYSAEPAVLRGAVLADLRPEGYPALFLDAAGADVHGWLYRYTTQSWPAALPFLDELEGLDLSPPLYRRVQQSVLTAAGPRRAWVYVYARQARRAAPGFFPVVSGRWADIAGRHQSGPRQTWEETGEGGA